MVLWLKLNGDLRKKLLFLPNTGINFHLVDVLLKNGHILKRVRVFESRVMELPSGFRCLKEDDILAIEPSE